MAVRKVNVPKDSKTVGQTNRFLKLPFAAPKTDSEHAANARAMEKWGNKIPYNQGGGGYLWDYTQVSGFSTTASGPDDDDYYPFYANKALQVGGPEAVYKMWGEMGAIPTVFPVGPCVAWLHHIRSEDTVSGIDLVEMKSVTQAGQQISNIEKFHCDSTGHFSGSFVSYQLVGEPMSIRIRASAGGMSVPLFDRSIRTSRVTTLLGPVFGAN